MMQVGTNQSTTYHSQPSIPTAGGQTGRSSSTSRQQQQQQQQPSQYDSEQLANIRPRLCILRKWPHYDGYGVHLARNQHWLGLRIGDVEPNSPAESGGLLREDVVLAVNGHSVENDDFFVILSFIQHELEDEQIRFLVLDPHSADLARRNRLNIDENYRTCVRMETPALTVSPEKLLYDQWRTANTADPTATQNTIHLGPTLSPNPNQSTSNTQRYQQRSPDDRRDDVYTFLPYSDHAIENGKSFFDILFDQDDHSSAQQQHPRHTVHYPATKDFTGDNDNDNDDNNNNEDHKDKKRGSHIKDGIKNIAKTGLENLKSIIPNKHQDDKDKYDSTDSKRRTSHDSVDSISNTPDHPSLLDKMKNKIKRSSSPTKTTEHEKPAQPYENLWQSSSHTPEDTNNNLRPEPRMCSLTIRPGIDSIGISLQPDKDFGHIIKQVEPNSAADHAGIERNDCIVSLNDKSLLNIPYDDVLAALKKSRNEPNLDFLVASKSYLLKSHQLNPSSSAGEVLPSSNISDKNAPSGIPASQALEQLYNKYNNERKSSPDEQPNQNRTRENISTSTPDERYDRLSPKSDKDRYPSKPQQGQIFQGVGPATADRSSWGVSSGKSADGSPAAISGESSIRSTSRDRRQDVDDTKGRHDSIEDSFKPLQVGFTNPTSSQQSGNISPLPRNTSPTDDRQRTSRPTSSTGQREGSPKAVPSPNTATTITRDDRTSSPSSRQNQTIQNISNATPIAPIQTASKTRDYDQGNSQTTTSNQPDNRLGVTKAMSVPTKPPKTNAVTAVYSDTDDDDLSDISERSREEDVSDPVLNRNPQSIANESADIKKNQLSDELPRTPVSAFRIAENTSDLTNKKPNFNNDLNEKRPLSSTNSDADRFPNASATGPRTVVKARQIEKSDSDDTTSAADSQVAAQSVADSFYSPDESIDEVTDTDEQPTDSGRKRVADDINQVKSSDTKQNQPQSKSSEQQQKQKQNESDDEKDDDDDDGRSTGSSSTESQSTPIPTGKMAFATMPISELKDHGYELHDIQLMQPTETSPVGLKLTKQQDPLQYVITAVAKDTKADLAGLKVDDWLIRIEDKDIRLVEFSEVSQEIRQLLTDVGLINMVIARKKTPTSSPKTKHIDKQTSPTIVSPKSESIGRQQGGQVPKSLLTTDITRDTPDNSQVRFTPEQTQTSSTVRSRRGPIGARDTNTTAPGGPLSVGLTNPRPDDNQTKSPRSQSPSPSSSPTREYTLNRQQKGSSLSEQTSDIIDPNEIRQIELKEPSGLDFNSFIPEGESQVQIHFISNVQPSSMADKAGLRDGDRILTVNDIDVKNAVHEDVRRMMQRKKPLYLTVVNDRKYLELIDNAKRIQAKEEDSANRNRSALKSVGSDSGSDSTIPRPKSDSPKQYNEDLSKYFSPLFTDDKGGVQVKHCILKKDPSYNGYGLLLRYQNGLHLIDQVEEDSPAYNAGLREDDVILYVDRKNVEQMTHDDVKILIRKLSLSNTNIDLVLVRKTDMQRYKNYQEKNSIDWKPIFQDKLSNAGLPTEQQGPSTIRSSNDSTNGPRKGSSSSSGKQPAPAPPTSSSTSATSTRVCILQPSAERTAGFALSGKAPPPYVICQIEKNSPAEKAGLRLNDTLLSINGKSVTETTYEDTVKLVKEALQQKSVELLVRDQTSSQSKDDTPSQDRTKMSSQSSATEQRNISMGSTDSSNLGNNSSIGGGDSNHRGTNAVEEYQKQRNKELSYTLRHCHLHPTNGDGTQAATFGFELSEEPDFEYPLILRVEPHSSAEGAGLQSRDILLKINERKTKGLGYDKVKKEIEKAKRDGRLEMLVVDQATYDYCKRTKKPLKEPEMKVKHIFPKTVDYDAPSKTTTSSKTRAPSPPIFRNGHHRTDIPLVSQSLNTIPSNTTTAPVSSIQDTVRSTISTGSFDYVRGPRRCVLKVDRNKGLGFVLSATGDYDHTITAVEKNSAAAIAGLQINDEVLEVDDVDVRTVKYEKVVEMLVSAMRVNDTIEMRVIDGRARDVYPSTIDADQKGNTNGLLNSNNNNNNTITSTTTYSQRTTAVLSDDISDINSSISPFDSLNQQKIATSYPNLPGQLKQFDNFTSRALSGSVPALATGITASPSGMHPAKSVSTSSERGSMTKLSDISSHDAPIARLCRVRKFATSPFYGFFLCGDPKKLGRVFISDVTKHSPASVCGLRDGDRIIEINGSTINALTYETILDKIKQHMARDDLELLVLDKKSVHWYRERNYPITSRTLPTIVHIEPIINDTTSEMQSLEAPATHTKMVGFADRRVSKTGL